MGVRLRSLSLIASALSAPAGAAALDCGAGVDSRFTEAAALCGVTGGLAAVPVVVPDTPRTVSVGYLTGRRQPAAVRPGRTAGRHDPLIHAVGRSYKIDPRLLAAMVHTESAGRQRAVSHKGALGLMQVMPATARGLGVRNPGALLDDPVLALRTGALYLKTLQAKFGTNLPLVIAAYNAGPGAVAKAGMRVPAYRETQGYVGSVLGRYAGALRSAR